mgnify:CR=1 FL=1
MASSYPASLDSAEDLYIATNNTATVLVGAITPSSTSITIANASGLQATSGLVSIGSEIIKYSSIDTGGVNPVLLGCTRGFDGSVAKSHTDGSRVDIRWVADHHNVLSSAIRKIQNELGVSPSSADFSSVALRLAANLPLIVPMSLGTDWSFTHDRRRIVGVQLWRSNGLGGYELFTAPVSQELNPAGTAQVTINLGAGNDEEGFIVVL